MHQELASTMTPFLCSDFQMELQWSHSSWFFSQARYCSYLMWLISFGLPNGNLAVPSQIHNLFFKQHLFLCNCKHSELPWTAIKYYYNSLVQATVWSQNASPEQTSEVRHCDQGKTELDHERGVIAQPKLLKRQWMTHCSKGHFTNCSIDL